MNILFINDVPEIQEEISEFLTMPNGHVFYSRNTGEMIRILNEEPIELVVLNIKSMRDAAILKYINDFYKELKVLIIASKEYDEIISIFSKCNYELFPQPLKLSELKKNIDKILTH